jgi:hypothetical protein
MTRVTVKGSDPFGFALSLRRAISLRSCLAFWRETRFSRMRIQELADNRQHADVVNVFQCATENGIFELRLEAARRPDTADRRKCAAIHYGVGYKRRSISGDQIYRRAHARWGAILVSYALPIDGSKRSQSKLVPMAGDVVERPELAAERLRA